MNILKTNIPLPVIYVVLAGIAAQFVIHFAGAGPDWSEGATLATFIVLIGYLVYAISRSKKSKSEAS